jgi:hypothetical protein
VKRLGEPSVITGDHGMSGMFVMAAATCRWLTTRAQATVRTTLGILAFDLQLWLDRLHEATWIASGKASSMWLQRAGMTAVACTYTLLWFLPRRFLDEKSCRTASFIVVRVQVR